MAELDYDALQRLADGATPGPWEAFDTYYLTSPTKIDGFANPRGRRVQEVQIEADRAFVAAARSAVPALLDRVRELEAERDAALSTIAKVEALHVPHPQTGKCAECTYAPFSQQSVAWPCPTVRAIREEAEDE